MKKLLILTMSAFLTMATGAFGATWSIDTDHSAANFSIKHMAIAKVKGGFAAVTGGLAFNEDGTTPSTLEITIDPASIDTGVTKRDNHLKSADFFDVEKYPTIHFVSTEIRPAGDNNYELTGTLTMHGVSNSVTVNLEGLGGEVKDPWGNIRKGAQITGKINRKDFGIVYNAVLEGGNLLIGEKADISVDLEFIRQ